MPGGDVRMAHRAEQDGVERAQLVEHRRRQDLAGAKITLAAQVEVLQLVADVFQRGDRLEDLDGFGGDFRTGAVAADHGDAQNVVAAHG